ncbi:beta-galactosidase trimerization domain-containing protein [Paenibacillus alkaliterrae]|uniref:beta-galactosidase trimerization domain-containing protein n=1 Tax=Paenibacillus alkaliterrae TaxID=320909 RepID=UPI002E1B885A
MLRDYDNEWDGEYDVWHGPFSRQSGKAWFKALTRRHIPSDTVYVRTGTTIEDLKRYKVLIYPHPAIMRDETAALLEQYTREGGIIIFGCRTGYKDERGHCYMRPFPGAAAALTGISVEEFTMVKGTREAVSMKWSGGKEALTGADSFNDVLLPESDSVVVVAHYASDYYAGKPAVTKNKFGEGEAWYFGAVFNESSAGQIIERLGLVSPAADWLALPEQVELSIRQDASGPLHFLLNYSEQPALITLSEEKTDLLTGKKLSGTVDLEGYGVLVLS